MIVKTSFLYQNQGEMGKYSVISIKSGKVQNDITNSYSQKRSENSFFQNANFIGEETKF